MQLLRVLYPTSTWFLKDSCRLPRRSRVCVQSNTSVYRVFNAEHDGEVRIAISHSVTGLERMNREEHLKQASKMGRISPVILVHGGAGDIPDSGVPEKIEGVKRAALAGFKVLKETDSVLDAIESSINVMEDLEGFNAGRGSVLTLTGEVEMEALITEGKDLKAGAITLAKNIRYPISVARKVMELTPHTFLGGAGLEDFIQKSNIPRVGDDWLITDRAKYALDKFIQQGGLHSEAPTEIGKRPGDVGTVGCIAVDTSGHVASGTSTGGISGKYKGRIGDTPQLGSGGYSDDNIGAVSTTGYGEAIMRYNLAHRILSKMETGLNAQDATKLGVDGMTERIKKTAGAITLSTSGDVGISFSSKRMAWAYVKDGELHYGINHGAERTIVTSDEAMKREAVTK